MKEEQFALLKVIEATMVDIKEDVKEIKQSLRSKVEVGEFNVLKTEVESLKKTKWVGYGVAGTISYIVTHFFR
jgi:regulator of replication initiation timing